MAKTGFWLRGASGKFAGAALQRGSNGETIIREIVAPSNPKTQAQMIQRIIMATVGTAYSAMKAITDHSYEGKKKGQETMSAFRSFNLNLLRDKVTAAVEQGIDLYDIYAMSPLGSKLFCLNGYQISRGSLPQVSTSIDSTTNMWYGVMDLAENTYQGVLDAYGLQRGDQLTFVTVEPDRNSRNHTFHFARVILDPMNDDGSQAELSQTFIADGRVNKPSKRNEGGFEALMFSDGKVKFRMGQVGGCGIIVSRQNVDKSWRRSDCTLTVVVNEETGFEEDSNGFSLGECLDKAQSGASINALSTQYLNGAGTGSYIDSNHQVQGAGTSTNTSEGGESGDTPTPSPTGGGDGGEG